MTLMFTYFENVDRLKREEIDQEISCGSELILIDSSSAVSRVSLLWFMFDSFHSAHENGRFGEDALKGGTSH